VPKPSKYGPKPPGRKPKKPAANQTAEKEKAEIANRNLAEQICRHLAWPIE